MPEDNVKEQDPIIRREGTPKVINTPIIEPWKAKNLICSHVGCRKSTSLGGLNVKIQNITSIVSRPKTLQN